MCYMYMIKHWSGVPDWFYIVAQSVVYFPSKFQGLTGGHCLGWACSHVKAFGSSPFLYQRKICTEGLLGRHALCTCMLGRTLKCFDVNMFLHVPEADLGILEWWVCMTNVHEAHMKILGHAHFIKTTPIIIAQQGSNMTADCTTNYLESGFRTCSVLAHYYHQPLSYRANQCISMAKHVL